MRKIIITGGSGFIGTNVINFFLAEGDILLNIDIVKPKLEEHLKFWKDANLCNAEELGKILDDFEPDYLIHLGARTDLNGTNIEDYDANIVGVKNLLNALGRSKNIKRVIFASSMYVNKPGYEPENYDDYNPHTIYGESKVITEKLIKQTDPDYTWCIIRPTSIWGPYFGEPYNLFFKIVLSKKYFHLGERACRKTYGYIDNFIYQLKELLTIQHEMVNKKVFYLGDYEPYNISEWADEIATLRDIKIPKIPFFLFQIAAKFGDGLKLLGIKFPMTSFRLSNMTTNNVHNLDPIQRLVPKLPVSRMEGTKKTIDWLSSN